MSLVVTACLGCAATGTCAACDLASQIDRRHLHPLVPKFMTDLLPGVSVGQAL